MHKTLVIGRGYLASHLHEGLSSAFIHPAHITSLAEARVVLKEHRPTHLINCAGITGRPTIDWCESHISETFFGNIALPLFLAQAALEQGVHFTHLGTGGVYTSPPLGSRTFSEADAPTLTRGVYTHSKLLAEQALAHLPVLQLRIHMPFSTLPGPRNLLTKLVTYARAGTPLVSAPNSLTYLPDCIQMARGLLEQRATGIYHAVSPGPVTHQELLTAYYTARGEPSDHLHFITPAELDRCTGAPRAHCMLSTAKTEHALGCTLPSLSARLPALMQEYVTHEKERQI